MGSQLKGHAPLDEVAARAVELAQRSGAGQAAAAASRSRQVEVAWRDGKIENLSEATERSLVIELFVEGRYAAVRTSDLRPAALEVFVADAVTMTRALTADRHRRLPDPELFSGRAAIDLELDDRAQAAVTADDRKQAVAAIEAAARAVPGAEALLSVSTSWSDSASEICRITSNGFIGTRRLTSFSAYASVTVKDTDGSRPEDYAGATTRHRADLPQADWIGREATSRALARLGATKGKSAVLPAVVENRAAGRLTGMLLGPLSGEALQQKRSFLEGKLGQTIGTRHLSFRDDPHLRRGLGSRLFDGEGLASRPRPVLEGGALASYYLDTYYARKLGVAPTSGGMTNLAWKLGEQDGADLVAGVRDGIFISSFLGGNSNAASGDFSLGVRGFRIRGGRRAEPIGEMNISGNQLELWKRLAAVGNDPYPWSAGRSPTLVFDAVQFAGV
jgi:PmbA protein